MKKVEVNVRLEQGMDGSEVVANELLVGDSEIGVGESGNLQGEGNGIERLGALGSRLTRMKEFQGFLDQLESLRQRKEKAYDLFLLSGGSIQNHAVILVLKSACSEGTKTLIHWIQHDDIPRNDNLVAFELFVNKVGEISQLGSCDIKLDAVAIL